MKNLTDRHKLEIQQTIVDQGGPYSAISFILNQTGPLKPENIRTNNFIFDVLEYILSIRHTSFGAINDIVGEYNIYYLDNKFHLSV